jgi:hypothetical protein
MFIKDMQTVAAGVRARSVRLDRPIPLLRERAAGEGFTNVLRARDGFVREADVVLTHDGQPVPSLAKAVHDRLAPELKARPVAPETRRILVNYRGPRGTFPSLPYYQVVGGELPSQLFADRIVLVGASALSLQDLHLAPFATAGNPTPGSEILANILDNLLAGDHLRALPILSADSPSRVVSQNPWYIPPILVAAVLAAGRRPVPAAARLPDDRGGLGGLRLGVPAGVRVGALLGRVRPRQRGAGCPVWRPSCENSSMRSGSGARWPTSSRRKWPADRPGSNRRGHREQRRPITILFSDIRDFTSISEGCRRRGGRVAREYFNTMVPSC